MRDDDLQMIAELGRPVPLPDPGELRPARHRLLAAAASERSRFTAPGMPRAAAPAAGPAGPTGRPTGAAQSLPSALAAAPVRRRRGRQVVVKGDRVLPGVTEPCTPDPAYRPNLPTTAEAMLAYLRGDAGGEAGRSPENVLDGLEDDVGHDRRLGHEGQVPGVDVGDVGARALGHERQLRGRDDLVRRPEYGPGRDGLPGRAAASGSASGPRPATARARWRRTTRCLRRLWAGLAVTTLGRGRRCRPLPGPGRVRGPAVSGSRLDAVN